MITYSSENVKFPNIKRRETTAWIRRVAATYGKKVGEVGYLFCDDEHILEVNREYLQHDYYTDIITFDYDEGDVDRTTKVLASANRWKQPRTRHWLYAETSNNERKFAPVNN